MDQQGLAWVEVTPEYLRKLLHAPDNSEIVGAVFGDGVVRLLFAAPELPSDGEIPTLAPAITHHRETFTWDWGIPEAADGA